MSLPVHVGALGLWTPGFGDAAAWLQGLADPALTTPAATLLPAAVRRRTTLLTRAAVEVFGQVAAGVEASTIPSVFGSAWGETSALQELLDQMHGPDGALSPIRFSGSVHNTASGQVSIATANRGWTTSLAAGTDTVAMGLLECLGVLAGGASEIIAVFADIDPPSPLADGSGHCTPLAVALHLHRGLPERKTLAILSELGFSSADPLPPCLPEGLRDNPCGGALALCDAVLRGRSGLIQLGAWTIHCQTEAP